MDTTIRSTHARHNTRETRNGRSACRGLRSNGWFHFSRLPTAPISGNMANSTRFDLSRLEGCSGTMSSSGVAVPHTLVPSRGMRGAKEKHRPAPAKPQPTPAAPEQAEIEPAEPLAEVEAEIEAVPAPEAAAVEVPKAPVAVPVMKAAPRSVEAIVAEELRTTKEATEQETRDELPLGVILALTLSVWIPVLLLWSSRLG